MTLTYGPALADHAPNMCNNIKKHPRPAPCAGNIAVLALLALLAACAAPMQQPVPQPEQQSAQKTAGEASGTWSTRASEISPEVVDDPPATVHTAQPGACLRADTDPASPRLDLLPQYRELIRFRTRSGYAKVLDTTTRLLGWVPAEAIKEGEAPEAPRLPEAAPGRAPISETF